MTPILIEPTLISRGHGVRVTDCTGLPTAFPRSSEGIARALSYYSEQHAHWVYAARTYVQWIRGGLPAGGEV